MYDSIAAVVGYLRGGTALMALAPGVYLGIPPGTATFPCITVDPAPAVGADNPLFAGQWFDRRYLIKCIDENTDPTPALEVQTAIEARVQGGGFTITGHTILSFRRLTPVLYQETEQGNRVYWHAGGIYQLTYM